MECDGRKFPCDTQSVKRTELSAKANGSWWFGMENERKKPEIGRISLEFFVCFRFMFIIRPLISLIQTFRESDDHCAIVKKT